VDPWLIDRLMCPACDGGTVREKHDELECADCGHRYDVVESIPILLPPVLSGDDKKSVQIQYYREEVDPEFELNRPHGAGRVYQYLMDYKINKALRAFGDVAGKSTLNVCCGSGMDCEYFASRGADVVGLDISLENARRAIERSQKYGFRLRTVVGDAERLPFKTGAFDFTFVHDGLHHLPKPHGALREMGRVGACALCCVEPARAFGTQISVLLGISDVVEDAGNVVYRFTEKELRALAASLGSNDVCFQRYVMYYPHKPGRLMRRADTAPLFHLFRMGLWLANVCIGHWGNKCMFFVRLGKQANSRKG